MSYKREIILNNFQQLVFDKYGKNIDRIEDLRADASERKIYRLFVDGGTLIGIYNENVFENLAFVNFTKTFIKLGLHVPLTLNVSADNLFYVQEDLGDDTLFKLIQNRDKKELFSYYKQALADLIRFQIEAKDNIDFNYCYQTKEFNAEVIATDLQKFNDCFVKKIAGQTIDDKTLERIKNISDKIFSNVKSDYFLYRDFQPRNIMIKNNSLYYIDYQSGRKGPLQYDVASFLYSGSISLIEAERCSLLEFYLSELHKFIECDDKQFKYYFYYFVFLRLLQVLGSYAFQNEQKKDKEVLKKIPKALINLRSIYDKIEDIEIKKIIEQLTVNMN